MEKEHDEECCESVEIHEELIQIVNETMPEETVWGGGLRMRFGKRSQYDAVRDFPSASDVKAE